jgi:WD40 repeat protein/mono/diheme cytochrome c family protein
MKSAFHFFGLVLLSAAGPAAAAEPELAVKARAILEANCHRCHGRDGAAKGGMDFVLDRDRLVARGKVVPGKSDESELLQRLVKGEMPPEKQKPRPTDDDLALLRRWIDAGAPGTQPADAARTFVTDADVVRLILADLQSLEPGQRRFTRYLTLSHLYNAGVPAHELETTRQAVAKLINSLSWHPRVRTPEPIDAARTILRLDLRHYQWNARSWERLQSAYPYPTNDGPDLPFLRADWFVATASRPPLYHDLLQLPSSDRELERLLRVDVLTDWREENVVRLGFNRSGVARNNRLLERHDAAYGAYWRSYDFSDNTDRQNLFRYPLGLLPGRESFTPAGGEIIFHLPNGLHGFLLVDGNGRRVDRAPVEIVSDTSRPDRTVETGISCMGCHSGSIINKTDQVRAHVEKNPNAFSKEEIATVRAIYGTERTMLPLLAEDVERFQEALKKIGVPVSPDPVGVVAQRYEQDLDLAEAAAEVGLSAAEFGKRLAASPDLARILGPLRAQGSTVQRSAFQAAFPDLLRELRPETVQTGARSAPSTEDVRPFAGHTGVIGCIAFSADGKRAVTGSDDQTVRVWDVASGKEVLRLSGHTEEVHAVAFAPDGSRVASGGRDRTVRLWDAAAGKELRRFTGHTERITGVAFAPDGRRLLSASWDGTVRLWDVDADKELHRFTGHTGPVSCVVVAPDGRFALSGSHDGTVRLWDLEQLREVRRFEGHTREVYTVAFAPDGRRILSGGNDRTVRLWDAETGKELRHFQGPANAVIGVAFTPDGRRVLSGSSQYRGADRAVRVWDTDSGRVLEAFGAVGDSVWSIAFAPDGRSALTASADKTLRVWQLNRD